MLFVSYIRSLSLSQDHKDVLPHFLLVLHILALMYWSLIHFKVIFVKGMKNSWGLFSPQRVCVCPTVTAPFVIQPILPSTDLPWHFCHKSIYPCIGWSIGEGNGNPLQYSCLENPLDRGAWRAAVHRIAQSWTQLKQLSMHACMHWRRKWQPIPVFLPGESQG